jgi:hypothetical protein
MTVVKKHRRCDVAIESDDNGAYRVVVEGEVRVETRVLTLAELTYAEAVDELDPAKEIRARSASSD